MSLINSHFASCALFSQILFIRLNFCYSFQGLVILFYASLGIFSQLPAIKKRVSREMENLNINIKTIFVCTDRRQNFLFHFNKKRE